ncbi:hypothetical protein EEB13_30735 [Rhodococcus sp. WS3]|uniref:hypothetical protein n=1 Tax=unclassified Rhodococcus (in: high G+C Gram-positive bacteria) TaxID=192944 RepID=UPI00114288D4|nr:MULTISPECIES: hypothetical protein [unclassified Rhodococcus (in: high G+C Gram-positive bacteria)]ROZ42813.1 hypothetical protein EEB13_30735 [Rhodococcus sp. WS3]RZL20881.1 MAG: hypothetical protein EOP31_30570 [Rhodococcus sp. (in: high G+C Gram-positive bacteria)]
MVKNWGQIPLFDLDTSSDSAVDESENDSEPTLFELDDDAARLGSGNATPSAYETPLTEEDAPAVEEDPSAGSVIDVDRGDEPMLPDVGPVDQSEAPHQSTEAVTVDPATLPSVGVEADGHAVIVTAAGAFAPSGEKLTGPVDSIEKLDKLIRWATLTPLGAPAQVWVVGIDACEMLGWIIDPGDEDDVDDMEILRTRAAEELTGVLHATLTPMLTAGWELRGDPGHVVHLSRTTGKFTSMVDIFIEPYVWTYWNKDFGWNNRVGDMGILGSPTAGTYLPDDDLPAARELGRRLSWCARYLGVLPGPTPARTGAAVLDKIKRERTRSGKGIAVTTGGPIPPLNGEPRGDLEPEVGWTRVADSDDLTDAAHLVSIDQRAAYLASAGMLDFGYGKPRHLIGENAISAAASGAKGAPFGLWRITLPAGNSLALPAKLPLPHPHMLADQPVQTWVTSVSLDGLQAPVADGGIGAELDDLDITEAWVYPEQGRALDKWAKILREGRKVAVDTGDIAMKRFLGACYKGYIGRMVNPDMWTAKQMQHHHQPLWRASIIAHCRWRGRRVAMRIARESGRWPVRTVTDSWVYLLGEGEDIADDSDALGKMSVEKRTTLSETLIDAFNKADDTHEMNLVIKDAFTPDEGQ